MWTGGWWFFAIVVCCSGQVAWPVQSFSPEVARMLQTALSSIAVANLPSKLSLEPYPSRTPPTAPQPMAFPPSIPLSSPDGPRDQLVPVVERPVQEPLPAPFPPPPTAPLPPPPSAPQPPPPSVSLPGPMEPQPPSMPPPPVLQLPEAPREAPFYLTAATRLRMPSLYPQMIPIPFLSGSPSVLFAMPSAPVPTMQGIPAQPQAQLPPTPYTYIPLGEAPSAPEVPPPPPAPQGPQLLPPPPPQGPQLPSPPQPMLSPSPAPLITDSALSPAPLFATGFPSQGFGPMPTPVPFKAL